MTGNKEPSKEVEIKREIENYKKRRKRLIASSLIAMFGIFVLPFENFILVLAIVGFVIAPGMCIYYTWRKRQLEEELEDFELDEETKNSFDSLVKK